MVDDSKTIRLNLNPGGVSMAVYATEVLREDLRRKPKPARKSTP